MSEFTCRKCGQPGTPSKSTPGWCRSCQNQATRNSRRKERIRENLGEFQPSESVEKSVPVYLWPGPPEVYFLYLYRPKAGALRGEGQDAHSAELYRAKQTGDKATEAFFSAWVEGLRDELQCDSVIAVPPSIDGENMIQRVCHGMGPATIEATASRPNRHNLQEELTVEQENQRVEVRGAVSGKILLVDDVCTTGQTLQVYKEILLRAGAESVVCAAIGKTNCKFSVAHRQKILIEPLDLVDPVDEVENYLEDEPLLPLEMPTAPEVSLDFGDRANLSNSLRAQMEETAKHFGVLVEFNRVRLKMAAEAGAPRALESAEKAYRAAVVSQSEFLQKILDKLQLLQELKTQEGAAGKAVTFTLNGIPNENEERGK